MEARKFEIDGPALIIPKKIGDNRGFFMEAFKDAWFRENVADVGFVQDNQSFSAQKGTLRGLHYQKAPFGQGKLVRVLKGAIFDVAVDIRQGSKSFGKWVGVELSADNAHQLWIPDGFLHGFCTLTEDCEVFYKVTNPYSAECDAGIAFDDSDIAIKWPIDLKDAVLSQKDKTQPSLQTLIK